jgi:hypothetical protein
MIVHFDWRERDAVCQTDSYRSAMTMPGSQLIRRILVCTRQGLVALLGMFNANFLLPRHHHLLIRLLLRVYAASGGMSVWSGGVSAYSTVCSIRMCSSKCAHCRGMKPCNRPESMQQWGENKTGHPKLR